MVEDDENGGLYSQVISREKQSFRHLWKRSHWWAMNTDMPRVPHKKSENKRGQTLFFSTFGCLNGTANSARKDLSELFFP